METILLVPGAALLYLLLLPLFGVLVGLFVRIVLPYGAGAFLLYLLVAFNASVSHVVWYAVGASLLWVAVMLQSRTRLQKIKGNLAWYEGHYSSALNILTLSRVARSRKKAFSS